MWESIREITKQRPRSVESEVIARVCATILFASGFKGASKILTQNDMEVCEACDYLIRSPRQIETNLSKIKLLVEADRMMHGSREDRVRAFELFVNKNNDTSIGKTEFSSFLIGYLASRIAPGTIRHSSVLNQISHRYPSAMLWYGFCSGFAEREVNILELNQRRGVDLPLSARRVIRELFRAEPILGAPICDIGYSELLALSRTGGDPLESIIKTTPGSAIVELLPGVFTSVNVSSKPPIESIAREFREREILTTMGEQIERLRASYKALFMSQLPAKEAEQRTLFPSRRKEKKYVEPKE